jgi:hypothetical protein
VGGARRNADREETRIEKYRAQLMAGELRARESRLREALHSVHRCEIELETLRNELRFTTLGIDGLAPTIE